MTVGKINLMYMHRHVHVSVLIGMRERGKNKKRHGNDDDNVMLLLLLLLMISDGENEMPVYYWSMYLQNAFKSADTSTDSTVDAFELKELYKKIGKPKTVGSDFFSHDVLVSNSLQQFSIVLCSSFMWH